MAVWRAAGAEVPEGRVGDYVGVWVLGEFDRGCCGLCLQAGYFVSLHVSFSGVMGTLMRAGRSAEFGCFFGGREEI